MSKNINAIIGGNDSAFHPNILESFHHTNHIKFIDSIPYFPQSNGLNERYQQTILNICKAAIIEFNPHVETISQLLSHCAFINYFIFHKSINCIPYEKAKITVDPYNQAITPFGHAIWFRMLNLRKRDNLYDKMLTKGIFLVEI